MPRVVWKEYLKDPSEFRKKIDKELQEKHQNEKQEQYKLKLGRERKLRFEARKHAKRCIKDLVFIVENMGNVSGTPEKEFARIFTDDNSDALSRIGKARIDGLFGLPSISVEQASLLVNALRMVGIESDFLRLQRDSQYRGEMHYKMLEYPNYSFLRDVALQLEETTSIREVGEIDIRVPKEA